jgi:hypothetical protein
VKYLIAAVIVALQMGWSAWVFSVLWNWYAVFYLHAPTLPLLGAIGLMVLARLATFTVTETPKDPDKQLVYVVMLFVYPAVVLVIGAAFWLLH